MERVARALVVRPGEGRLVALVATTFAVVETGRGLGEVGADALVVGGPMGADVLPPLYVALGVVGLVLALAYSAALAGARDPRFFPALLLLTAGVLLGGWLIARGGSQDAASLLWVAVASAGALLVTVSWTVAGRVFHARQARRLFPLCASAAIAGSFVGQLAAGPVAQMVGVAQLVVLEALFLGLAAVVVSRIGRPLRATTLTPGELGRSVRDGAAFVAGSPLLRLIAVAYVLFAVLLVGVSFTFQREVLVAFPDETSRATALGLFSAVITAVAFVVSMVVANRVTARIGVTATAVSLPLVYLAGFLVWTVQLSLATAAAVRFAQVVTQRGLSNAAWSSFFSVVPAGRRAQVLAFIDGVPGQAGTILSGLLLMAGVTIGRESFVAGAIIAVAVLAVVIAIRRAYVTSVVATLREGIAMRVLDGGPDLVTIVADPGILDRLLEGVSAPDPEHRRIVASLLGSAPSPDARTALSGLVADPDPGVREAALRALAASGAGIELAHSALGDAHPGVRAAAVALLGADAEAVTALDDATVARLADDPAVEVRAAVAVGAATAHVPVAMAVARALLTDDDAAARAHAAAVLAARPDLLPDTQRRLVALLEDPAGTVRRAAARAIAAIPGGGSSLVSVVIDGSAPAREAALAALADADDVGPGERERLLAWGTVTLARARAFREQAAEVEALASSVTTLVGASVLDPQAVLRGLTSVLRTRQREATEGCLGAVRALCPPDVGRIILRSLRSGNAETRAQAIEALEVTAGGTFARHVAALMDEPAPYVRPRPIEEAVGAITTDPDAWLRAFALRTLCATPRADDAVERIVVDPDPVLRRAFGDSESWRSAQMPSSMPAVLATIDRMLLLGRVPLFGGLSPEDLSRIAATATEASYPTDDVLMGEGDAGDHLVVVVEGSVRVVKVSPAGERLLRRVEAGEHIGELAMLRGAPRAATVIAEPPGVRALLLDADGLRSVLRERPDAAMAMLATLADRISQE